MGVDTKAKILGAPRLYEIAEFLKTVEGMSNVEVVSYRPARVVSYTDKETGEELEYLDDAIGRVNFTYRDSEGNEECRGITAIDKCVDNTPSDSISPLLKEEYTWLKLSMKGSSVEIMEIIASNYGGFVIPDDCAAEDEDFFYQIDGSGLYEPCESDRRFWDALSRLGLEEAERVLKSENLDREAFIESVKDL